MTVATESSTAIVTLGPGCLCHPLAAWWHCRLRLGRLLRMTRRWPWSPPGPTSGAAIQTTREAWAGGSGAGSAASCQGGATKCNHHAYGGCDVEGRSQRGDLPPLLKVEHAYKLLGVSRSVGYRAATSGDLPTSRWVRRVYVPTARPKLLGLPAEEKAG